LEIWVSVDTDPVNGVEDIGGRCSVVGPRGPCVDVTNRSLGKCGALEGRLELVDAREDGGGILSYTGICLLAQVGITVEILASNRDTNDQVSPARPLSKSGRQGSNLGVECAFIASGPETEEKRGLGAESSWDGLGRFVGRASTLLGDC
jgi:hypothetical protein